MTPVARIAGLLAAIENLCGLPSSHNKAATTSGVAVRPVVGAVSITMNQNQHRHHRRWVIVLAVFAAAALLLLLRVILSHEREQPIPKSLIMHGK
jgi:uncharacterized membrane protein (UPF0136 family)